MSTRSLLAFVSMVALLALGALALLHGGARHAPALEREATPSERLDRADDALDALPSTDPTGPTPRIALASSSTPDASRAATPADARGDDATLDGHVMRDGASVPGRAGTIELWNADRLVSSTTLDPRGRFRFVCPEHVTYRLVARVTGHVQVEREVVAKPGSQVVYVELPDPNTTVIQVELIAPNGRPFVSQLTAVQLEVAAFLRPVLTAQRPVPGRSIEGGMQILSARGSRADNRGEPLWFSLRSEPRATGWCSLVLVDRVLHVAPFEEGGTVRFVLDPLELQVSTVCVQGIVVRADDGRPIRGATVRLDASHDTHREARSDENGFVRLDDVHVGPIAFAVAADGRTTARIDAVLAPGRPYDWGVVRLEGLVRLSGRVNAPTDLLDRLQVVFLRLRPDKDELDGFRTTASVSADGSFARGGLDAGRYALGLASADTMAPRPGDDAWSGLVIVDARQRDVEGLVVPMTRAFEETRRRNQAGRKSVKLGDEDESVWIDEDDSVGTEAPR